VTGNSVLTHCDVSIIIVNYNTCALLRDCLASIYERTGGIAFEVIVSDNGSTDGSIDMIRKEFPQAALIENNANLGFGAANNRGAAVASGEYLLFLNSDTTLENNAPAPFASMRGNTARHAGRLSPGQGGEHHSQRGALRGAGKDTAPPVL